MVIKYYLVTLCDKDLQRMPAFTNHLVVGFDPVEWFTLTDRDSGYTLLNFWEISETAFECFSHDEQNAAWDTYQAHTSEVDD